MITEPRVFDDDYPAQIKHREAEINVLSTAVEPILDGDRGNDMLLYGPSGVGKSALTRYVLDQLDQAQPTAYARVRCLGKSTAGILRSILRQLPGSTPAKTASARSLSSELKNRISEPTVVVLDEGDDLPATDSLSVLRGVQKLSWVAICHDHHDWLSRVDDDTRHAVTSWTLGLEKYTTAELSDILDERRRVGLEHGVVSDRQLEQIADDAAGVARDAIYGLRAAARLAEERSHETIRESDVGDCWARAQRQLREDALDSLPYHHHVCYEIIRRRGPIRSAEFHRQYDIIADVAYSGRDQTPVCKRERRNKLQKLADYDLILQNGERSGREYRPADASITSPLDLTVPVP